MDVVSFHDYHVPKEHLSLYTLPVLSFLSAAPRGAFALYPPIASLAATEVRRSKLDT